MEKKPAREWKNIIEPALKSKENEFKTVGYREATISDIWECLEKQVWKGNPQKKLYEVIQDVFHLQPNTYMNHIRIGALKSDKNDLMTSINALKGNNEN